mmetsp:Transcript_19327/g.29816  ORF Transcript_19327/g.29816 Transcript_19327/m.29816 type:complete len:422 (-) Transcript_19327:222-1487(-)
MRIFHLLLPSSGSCSVSINKHIINYQIIISPQQRNRMCSIASRRRYRHFSNNSATSFIKHSTTLTLDGKWELPTFIHGATTKSKVKPLLLLLSGWTGAGLDWGSIPRMIAAKTQRCVVTYDARGIGNSQRRGKRDVVVDGDDDDELHAALTSLDLSMDVMAMDAMAVARASMIEIANIGGRNNDDESNNKQQKVSIAGVSMGGMVAMHTAGWMTNSNKSFTMMGGSSDATTISEIHEIIDSIGVESMVLISSTAGGFPTGRHSATAKQEEFFRAFDDWSDGDVQGLNRSCAEMFFSVLGDDFLKKPGRSKLRNKLVDSFVSSRNDFINKGKVGINAQLEALRRFDSDLYLPCVGRALPSLVIHGGSDQVLPRENATDLHAMLGGTSNIMILPDADHHCWITHGHEVVSRVSAFLEEQEDFH